MWHVAGEHLFRKPWLRMLANFFLSPIIRRNGIPATEVVGVIKDRLAGGASVWMSPEGVHSINGETAFFISPATGKLVKESRAGLVTYRIHRGYLRSPRRAVLKRKGLLYGEMGADYAKEQLEKMSVDAINAAIRRDLYVNVFQDQQEHTTVYDAGDRLAEDLETVLYSCMSVRTAAELRCCTVWMTIFLCECGFSVRYTEYGLFASIGAVPAPFDNIID